MQTYSKDKMGQFTAEQRIFMVLHYNRTQSLVAMQNAFRNAFLIGILLVKLPSFKTLGNILNTEQA